MSISLLVIDNDEKRLSLTNRIDLNYVLAALDDENATDIDGLTEGALSRAGAMGDVSFTLYPPTDEPEVPEGLTLDDLRQVLVAPQSMSDSKILIEWRKRNFAESPRTYVSLPTPQQKGSYTVEQARQEVIRDLQQRYKTVMLQDPDNQEQLQELFTQQGYWGLNPPDAPRYLLNYMLGDILPLTNPFFVDGKRKEKETMFTPLEGMVVIDLRKKHVNFIFTNGDSIERDVRYGNDGLFGGATRPGETYISTHWEIDGKNLYRDVHTGATPTR